MSTLHEDLSLVCLHSQLHGSQVLGLFLSEMEASSLN